jgi:LmbE family N-acetylglucosaminyl deacetylase
LFQPLPKTELPLVDRIRQDLALLLPVNARLVSPLALGGHIDHRLVRRAAEALQRPLYYYADYPYAGQVDNQPGEISQPGWEAISFTISEDALRIWQAAIAEHRGQISTFWSSLEEMESQVRAYWQVGGGSKLWRTAIRSTNDYKT